MTTLDDPAVKQLLSGKNYAVVSTLDAEGGIHSAVVWADVVDGQLALNSAVGRKWPTHLESNPTINVLIYKSDDPYEYVEVRGTAHSRLEGADAHIDALAKKYLDADSYPFRQPGEQRITYLVDATSVRYQKQ
jgi:PPOX class probable F420-dependent enzyme